MAEFSDAERRRAEAEAEQRDQEQRQLEAREAARQENRRRLEEQAARAERAARERAQGVQGFQGMKSMEREQPASEPPSAAAERRSPGSTYQASTTPAGPSATPRAEDISAPSVRGEWEVPDYVAEPEFDDAPEQDALSMADELFGARPQGRRGGEDA
jgi:hypothetical protein